MLGPGGRRPTESATGAAVVRVRVAPYARGCTVAESPVKCRSWLAMSGTEWDRGGDGPVRRPISLVSESESTVFDTLNESRFATVTSSGTRDSPGGFHPHLGRPLDELRAGPTATPNGHGPEGGSRGTAMEPVVGDELGITAKSQRVMKEAGRMCMGVSIPGTGHTAYVFDLVTTRGERWKVTRRFSDFLELDKKLKQMFGKPTRPFPPLPKKILLGNQAGKVVEERQQMLSTYLQAVLDNRILSSTDCVRKFVDMEEEGEEPVSVLRGSIPRGSVTNGHARP